MNLRTKLSQLSSSVKSLEGQYKERCNLGSKDMNDYLELRYYSGLRNGLNFITYILENGIKEEDFEKMSKEMLHLESIN